MAARSPLVGIVMGSASDWDVMREAAKQLTDFSVPFDTKVLSAHRTPDALENWVKRLSANGARCFIAGAGGAAHLAGVVAAKTTVPVLGVPMPPPRLMPTPSWSAQRPARMEPPALSQNASTSFSE